MKQRHLSKRWFASLSGMVPACMLAAALGAFPIQVNAQGRGERPQPGSPQPGSPQRGGSPQAGGFPQGGVMHARREVVQTRTPAPTPRYVPPPSIRNFAPRNQPMPGRPSNPSSPPMPSRPVSPGNPPGLTPPVRRPMVATYANPPKRETPQGRTQRAFTRTPQGRHYDNGLQLRRGMPVRADWQRRYFPHGTFHYPYYVPNYDSASVVISPFGYFFGVCAPFIARDHCYFNQPAAVYVDVPIFVGDTCQGFAPVSPDDNYLDLDALRDREPGLANAIDELREAFGRADIDALVTLIDPNSKIAIFERGRYQYSLDADDFVDMTRDAFRSMQTFAYDLTRIHERAAGVYVVSGEHIYRDPDGRNRTVYVSYVLEDMGGIWTLTQVGTAPDRIQSWQ